MAGYGFTVHRCSTKSWHVESGIDHSLVGIGGKCPCAAGSAGSRRFLRGPRNLFSPAGSDPLTQVGTAALKTAMPPASVAVEGGLDCFDGGELRSFGRRDRDRLAGLRIAPLPLTTLGDPERP